MCSVHIIVVYYSKAVQNTSLWNFLNKMTFTLNMSGSLCPLRPLCKKRVPAFFCSTLTIQSRLGYRFFFWKQTGHFIYLLLEIIFCVVSEWGGVTKTETNNFRKKPDVQVTRLRSSIQHFVPLTVTSFFFYFLNCTAAYHTRLVYAATASVLKISSTNGRPISVVASELKMQVQETYLK